MGQTKELVGAAKEIFEHLEDRPEAGDTLEGIATWWLNSQIPGEPVELVRQAILRLKESGRVAERVVPGGQVLYSLRERQG